MVQGTPNCLHPGRRPALSSLFVLATSRLGWLHLPGRQQCRFNQHGNENRFVRTVNMTEVEAGVMRGFWCPRVSVASWPGCSKAAYVQHSGDSLEELRNVCKSVIGKDDIASSTLCVAKWISCCSIHFLSCIVQHWDVWGDMEHDVFLVVLEYRVWLGWTPFPSTSQEDSFSHVFSIYWWPPAIFPWIGIRKSQYL